MVSGRLMEEGPVPVLAAEQARSVVAGGVMQPWKLTGGAEPPTLDADAFRRFAEPGWVKAGMAFVLEPDGDGTRVITETRVRATDRRSLARFTAYWLVIRGVGVDPARHAARDRATGGGGGVSPCTPRAHRCADRPRRRPPRTPGPLPSPAAVDVHQSSVNSRAPRSNASSARLRSSPPP
jgi:hypothetical protein